MLPLIGLLFSSLLSFSFSQAAEFYEPYQSTRQLGMGGVYVFHENDADSFLQNPAYTCQLEGLNWTVFDAQSGLGDLQSYTELVDAGGGSVPDPTAMSGLTPFYGKNIWLNATGNTTFTLPCFGFAMTFNGVANLYLNNPAFPELNTYYLTDTGFHLGAAIPISQNLSFGFSAKRIVRKGGPYTFGPSSLTTISGSNGLQTLIDSVQNTGGGYGLDMGLVSRFSMLPFNPTLSLGWRDVGSTSFIMTSGTGAPERQKDNLVLGMTIDGSIPLLGMAAGVEYRHINDNTEQLGKKLHFGAELSLGPLDARAGFYQGYPTYGVGMNFWFFQLEAAYYKVEKGVYPGQTPDERVKAGIYMDLAFDPNFNFMGAGGKKRKLKQRR